MTKEQIEEIDMWVNSSDFRDADAAPLIRLLAERAKLLEVLRRYHEANRIHNDAEAALHDLSGAAVAFAEEEALT